MAMSRMPGANLVEAIREANDRRVVASRAAPHGTDIEELKSHELGTDAAAPTSIGLFGLALSGGGIRSATFSLGVLQGLHSLGILQCFDYLSTVSGGGYIGGFWSAWRRKNAGAGTVFPPRRVGAAEGPAIRHVREFSNYLSPRLGLFNYDTGRVAIAGVAGAVPSLIIALSFLTVVLAMWAGTAWVLLDAAPYTAVMFAALTLLSVFGFEAAWQRRDGRIAHHGFDWAYIVLAALAVAGCTFAWTKIRPVTTIHDAGHWLITSVPAAEQWWHLFAPCAAWSVVITVLVLLRAGVSRWINSGPRVTVRGTLDRLLARLLFLVLAWAVFAGLWIITLHLQTDLSIDAGWLATVTGTLAAIFVWARRLMGNQPSKPIGAGVLARLRPRVPMLLAYAVVLLMMIGVITTLTYWQRQPEPLLDRDATQVIVVGAALILGLGVWLFHPNRIGLHSFYRGRLARAYLGASNHQKTTEELADDDFEIKELRFDRRPVHLICCAANDLTPAEPLKSLERGAVSAVLSPHGFSVGSHWKLWQQQETPSLGAAMTASGAAFNSMMGAYTKRFGPASTFLMSALNLRLGMWLRNPNVTGGRPSRDWGLPGWLFYKELLGISSADGADVHLSDGGHFENMGVYELIRRRCRFILACDCGADPDYAFDDLANLIRRVREDFSVEIRIDVSPLRPTAGAAVQPMVAGDIHYHDGTVGTLLLLKPTLTGREPADIAQYVARNRAFPAESTGDQFYDEAQWESYRRLGEFAVETAFGFVSRDARLCLDLPDTPCDDQRTRGRPHTAPPKARARAIFARARFGWLPRPRDFDRRLASFNDRAIKIDKQVAELHNGLFFRGVFKEIPRLDDAVKHGVPDGSERQLIESLHIAREAILLMEETYYAWELDATYNQPLNLGVMNYFARWAFAPVIRMWWPIAKSMYTPPFTLFMESHFGLKGVQPSDRDGGREDVIALITAGQAGFAMSCWQSTERAVGMANARFIAYRLRMEIDGERSFDVQAALLAHSVTPLRASAHAQAEAAQDSSIAYWDARDFFVPPGLWGIGIGEDFMDRLVHDAGSPLREHRILLVRVPLTHMDDAVRRKATADTVQLYRSAGFQDVIMADGGIAVCIADAADVNVSLNELELMSGDPRDGLWLACAR